MKKITIKAYKKVNDEKVFAGERVVEQPETLAEAVKLEEAEAEEKGKGESLVLARYWDSKVIAIQSAIRREGEESERTKVKKLRAFAAANPNSEVAKTLKSLNINF